jgi:PAS domain S-box-containing protein
MLEILHHLFSSGDFMPHGYCYMWEPGLVWLHAVSDGLIALAYFVIPIVLLYIVRKRRDLPFNWMVLCFGLFIVACGSTHAFEIWNLWHADYWLSGVVKAITAVVSVGTAILLVQLVPQALELPSPASMEKVVGELRQQAELLDLAHDAILVRDLNRVVTYWNLGAEKLYGWKAEEAEGNKSHDLLSAEYPKPLHEIEAEVIARGTWEGELVHQRKNGSTVIVTSRWSLRRGKDGQPASILEINRDISAGKRAEEKFRGLLEAAPDAMVIVNQEGRIELTNAQAETLFGYTRAELIGQPVEILIPDSIRTRHAGHRENYFQTPRTRQMGAGLELAGRRKDGSEFPVEISLSPLETGKGVLVTSAIRDITERKQSEDLLRKTNEVLEHRIAERTQELAKTNRELQEEVLERKLAEEKVRELNAGLERRVAERTEQLVEVNKELESFSYSVSHDLRAPLRHIDGFSRILIEEYGSQFDEDGQRYLHRIVEGAQQMGMLVDDLLNLSRVGRRELQRQHTNLEGLVQNIVADLAGSATERKIEWKVEMLPEADCDPGLLRIVFMNLLSNAVKFSRRRDRAMIEVGCEVREEEMVFFVRDNGVGFDQKYADKLFGVFQRLHRQEEFEGTGIGLATVHRIVRKHGGRIWAESVPGEGATFFFTLASKNGLAREVGVGKEQDKS